MKIKRLNEAPDRHILPLEEKDFEIDDNGVLVKYRGNGGNVVIPDGVTEIGGWAFYKCTELTSVTIPDSVTKIGNWAFRECPGLKNVTIGNGVTKIGDWAFGFCTGLTGVTIGNSLTSIGESAFNSCTGLTKITIPDSVTSIGFAAFMSCKGLTRVTIPDGVKIIAALVFAACTSLKNITIPNSVTKIGDRAFEDCISLTKINIPSSVTEILYGAFNGCTKLAGIVIPNSVTIIRDETFKECTGLMRVTIPAGVYYIGDDAFAGCNNLKNVYYQGTEENWLKTDISYYDNSKLFDANIHFNSPIKESYGKMENRKNLLEYDRSNKQRIADERAKWQAEYDVQKAAHDEEEDRYHKAKYDILNAVKENVESILPFSDLVEVTTRDEYYDWSDFEETAYVSVRIEYKESWPNRNPSQSLRWEFKVSLDREGNVKKETNSWSGLQATTEDQIEDLEKSVTILKKLNRIDWKEIMMKSLPKYGDYITTKEPQRRNFGFEEFEADLQDAVGEDVLFVSKYDWQNARKYYGGVAYGIKKLTNKRAEVFDVSLQHALNYQKYGYEDPRGVIDKNSKYTYQMSKEKLKNELGKDYVIIDYDMNEVE